MRTFPKITAVLLLLTVLCGAVPVQAGPAGQPNADGPNLLVNPGFESPFIKQCCHTEPQYLPNTPIDEIQVATGWRGWWLEPRFPDFPPTCDNCTSWHRPEWREAAPFANRIHSGSNAQKYFTFYSVHKAGMYQQVGGITPGQRLRFSIYMQAWSTGGNSLTSTVKDNDMAMKVGIDPYGGSDPFSSRIVWSAPFNTYDMWGLYSIEAIAQSSTVTVFTHSQPRWGLQHNDMYLDDASLVVVNGSSAPPPAPTATNAPAPSSAPPTAVPPTAVPPTAAPAPAYIAYTIQRGDTLYGIARKFGTTINTLLSLNSIGNASRIYPGQTLRIPNGAGAPAPSPAPTGAGSSNPPPAPNTGQVSNYVILRGDRLVYIARRFNITLNALLAANPGIDPSRIFPGQVIVIPATQATHSYVVQAGDTLRIIADRFGVSMALLQALNNLGNPNLIFIGQTLLIP